MAAPTVETNAFTLQGSASATITANKPTGVAENDLMICIHGADSNHASAMGAPAGWTAIEASTNSGGSGQSRGRPWEKVAGGSEASTYAFTTPDTEEHVVNILRISGVDTTTPIDVSGVATSNGSPDNAPTCPDVTTTVADTLIIRAFIADDDGTQTTEDSGYPAGTTGIGVKHSSTNTGACAVGVAWETQASAGATGTAAFTTTNDTQEWVAFTIAIAPSATNTFPFPGLLWTGDL